MITWNISEMQRKETNGFVTHVWYRVDNVDEEYSSVATGECDYIQTDRQGIVLSFFLDSFVSRT